MSSLLGAFILSLTVMLVVALGIVFAYGSVILILRTFASRSRRPSPPRPVLVAKTHAAHAGGD